MADRLNTVLIEVGLERKRQDEKWGEQNHENPIWSAILGEEYGEACKEVLNGIFDDDHDVEDLITELIQVAAVAVAWVECLERNK